MLVDEPGRGAVFVAWDPDPVGLALLSFQWTVEQGGLVAWPLRRVEICPIFVVTCVTVYETPP